MHTDKKKNQRGSGAPNVQKSLVSPLSAREFIRQKYHTSLHYASTQNTTNTTNTTLSGQVQQYSIAPGTHSEPACRKNEL